MGKSLALRRAVVGSRLALVGQSMDKLEAVGAEHKSLDCELKIDALDLVEQSLVGAARAWSARRSLFN